MNTQTFCKTCKKPKATFACGICSESICKNCTQFLSETFSFQRKVPQELTHSAYCTNCFDENVAGPLNEYNDKMERAKEIIIFTNEQTKITRLIKRKEEPYLVDNCEDSDEALMRMSFFAVEANHNCLIDVAFKYKKIVIGSHKKSICSGTAVPVTIDPKRVRDHDDH